MNNRLLSADLLLASKKELKKYVKAYLNDLLVFTKEVDSFDNCYVNTQECRGGCGIAVIGGKLYYAVYPNILLVNNDTDWKSCSGLSVNDDGSYSFAIKNDGSLYRIRCNNSNLTVAKRTTSPVTGWTKITGFASSNGAIRATGLNGGYIYSIWDENTNQAYTYNADNVREITGSHDSTSSRNIVAFYLRNNEFKGFRHSSSTDMYISIGLGNAKYIASSTIWQEYSVSGIRSDGKAAFSYQLNTGGYSAMTVKKVTSGYFPNNDNYAIGTDGCLYYKTGALNGAWNFSMTKIGSNSDWVNVIGYKDLHYATRAGKLYKVQGTTLTEITSAGKGVVDIAGSTQNGSIMLVYTEE